MSMGRPREHNADTAQALLAAGERLTEREGVDALSVRRLANEVGTTTRAVYSLFGSKDGLVVALGARAFELLGGAVASLADTKDPVADLVAAGLVFREFSRSHPSLFRIAVRARRCVERPRGAVPSCRRGGNGRTCETGRSAAGKRRPWWEVRARGCVAVPRTV